MALLSSLICLASIGGSFVRAQVADPNNETAPTSTYMTRPQANAPVWNFTVAQPDQWDQGYIFIGPYQHVAAGPYIYDKLGNLIWDGFGAIGPTNAHDFRPCQYKGEPHLCVTTVNQQLGYGVGNALIINSNYRTVASIQTGGNVSPVDMHEFQLIGDGETALVSAYHTIPYDLSAYNVSSGLGWLQEGVFQEIAVETGEVMYEWFSSNHVDPSESAVDAGESDISGDGRSGQTAWDYFHINSVEKSSDGNYMLSARHTNTIYLVDGTDHGIIWRLSSEGRSDFDCTNFNFSMQHDARFVSENDTMTVISIFDNASNGFVRTANQSSGMVSKLMGKGIIALNLRDKTATMTKQTLSPDNDDGPIVSNSQGNTQLLGNGNTFHGWGDNPWVSEHNANGDIVLSGKWANVGPMNYRAYSAPWQSTPQYTIPAVHSYALSQDDANVVYVSWNGATTVATWRYYGAQAIGDNFDLIDDTGRQGFETVHTLPRHYSWVMVEALGPDGTSLRNSSYQPTFVPSEALVSACNTTGCAAATL